MCNVKKLLIIHIDAFDNAMGGVITQTENVMDGSEKNQLCSNDISDTEQEFSAVV